MWADLAADGVPEADREVRFEVDMRWFLQRWELTVPVPGEPVLGDGGQQVEALFREEYLRRFGAASVTTSGIVELVGIRAVGIGHMEGVEDLPGTGRGTASEAGGGGVAPLRQPCGLPPPRHGEVREKVSLKRAAPPESVAVHDSSSLEPGEHFAGPALVDASDTTIWVPSGMQARVDANRTLVIEAQP